MKLLERIAFLLLSALLLDLACALAEQETLRYFFLNPCESCSPEEDFARDYERVTGQTLTDGQVEFYNVFRERGRAAYEAFTQGWSEEDRRLPLLIVGEEHYAGTASVEAGLAASFGSVPDDSASRVYFLTAGACDSCERARATVEMRPAIVPAQIRGHTVSSEVVFEEISVTDEPERALALLRLYDVPDARRITPMILMGNKTVLSGEKEIEAQFLPMLRSGAALGAPQAKPEDAGESAMNAVSVVGTVAAGIAGGLNPCALSMLLVFLGAMLSAGKGVVRYGVLYLLGKLILYLALGLGLARLWARFAPPWFGTAVKTAATAVGIGLIVLNLADAINARRQAYGRIRNQLPSALRGGLRRLITDGAKGGWPVAVALLLGLAVGAGEFLCAGQLYLGVLIASVQAGQVLPIVVYSLAFLLPSAIVLAVVGLGRHVAAPADWALAHMPAIKLATAAVMAVILAVLWLGGG